jgi:hypothetical protein
MRSSAYALAYRYASAGMKLLFSVCIRPAPESGGVVLDSAALSALDPTHPTQSDAAFRYNFRLAYNLYLTMAKVEYLALHHHVLCGQYCDLVLKYAKTTEDRYVAMRYRTRTCVEPVTASFFLTTCCVLCSL